MDLIPTALGVLLLLQASSVAANVTYCWGAGSTGQLGDGQGGGAYTQALPTAVSSGPEFAAVQAGAQHICGLTAAGQAYCWGQALNGELGVGAVNGTYLAVPAPVAGNLTFTGLSLGEEFSCGIADSRAFCWGSGESGQLGTGNNGSSAVPAEVAGNHTFVSLAAGQAHACALTPDGQAWCWGQNFFGQLGNNSTVSSAVPVQVAGNSTFIAVAAGSDHTCALLTAIRQPLCWGSNAVGQLGNNASNLATTPTPVAADYSGIEAEPYSFASITAGTMFSCGNVIDIGFGVYCWGENKWGQLGPSPEYGFSNEPIRLPGTQRFALMSAGRTHVCGVDSQGEAYCWGDGAAGQLGTGTQGRVAQYEDYSSTTPQPVAAVGGSAIIFYSVSAGGSHTCGVSTRAAVQPSPSPTAATPPPTSAPAVVPSAGASPAALVPPSATPGPTADASSSPPPVSEAEGSNTAPAPPAPSSSFPIGAVVGAVAGAAAIAVLAFFAFRPRKGWLRKHRSTALQRDAEKDLDSSSSGQDLSPVGGKAIPAPLGTGELDSFLTKQSYGSQSHGTQGNTSSAKAANSYGTVSDPLLLYISSYLASHPPSRSVPLATDPHSGSSSGSSTVNSSNSGAALPLSPEMHMWQLEWSELEIERPIGHGSFGAVYRARWQETTVAVKVLIDKDRMSHSSSLELPTELMRALDEEAAVMIRMRHPNVVQFMGLCQVPPAIVTEFCARGSLYSCLQAARSSPAAAAELTWARRLSMATDAATGLLYLHMRDILHRDVKSPNYLVADHWGVKVSDFNLSRLLDNGLSSSSGGPLNPVWLAPELLRGGRATTASDVFSFGVVLWELLTWRLPWAGSGLSPFQIGAKVVAGERLELPPREALPGPDTAAFAGLDAYCALIQECWAAQPEQRPGMAQVVRRLRGLLEEQCGGGAAADEQAAGGGESV